MKEYVFTKCVKIEQRHVIILDHAVKKLIVTVSISS